jgi:hypothetical protein
MAGNLECPYCGRALPWDFEDGPVTCDGCEGTFDPAKVRYEPVNMRRRIAGAALLAVGAMVLVGGVRAAMQHDFRDPDTPMMLLTWVILSAVTLGPGAALVRRKAVVEDKAATGRPGADE